MSSGARDVGVLTGDASPQLLPFLWPTAHRFLVPAGDWAGVLFVLVNASLFVRPAEIIPALEDWPIYAVLTICALLVTLPALLSQLSIASLIERPISACVMGVFVVVILSQLAAGSIWAARVAGIEFLKLVLYYLLLLATVNSFARLRRFLAALVVLGVMVTGLAVLQYHGLIDIPALAALEQGSTDPRTGERLLSLRLVGTGIFNDPNDVCLLLVLTMAACAYRLEDRGPNVWRAVWLAPLGLFGYALTLTQSRGGFLALLSGMLVFIWVRIDWRRGLLIAAIALPTLFYVFAGRQTELGVGEGTGQDRIQIWSQGLTLFRHAPIFGIGKGRFVEEIGHVAHNSFLHGFAELGFFGGMTFLGGFALALHSLHRLRPAQAVGLDPDLARLRPFLMAMIAGYATGLMTLSRVYVAPTYLVLGLAAAYIEIVRSRSALTLPRVGTRLTLRLGALSAVFLACMYVFVRLFAHWG